MSGKFKDILIVEDQPFFQDILRNALVETVVANENIHKAYSGNQAISFLEKNSDQIGLILLDMKMEDGDGLTVLEFMEKSGLFNIPVYIVSSLDSEFISFVMQSLNEVEIRLVGFIPKDTPNQVFERIKSLGPDICSFLEEEQIKSVEACNHPRVTIDNEDIVELLNNDLLLYVQPKVHLTDGYITGFEVLSRLWHEELGVIEPNGFIRYLDTDEKTDKFNWLVIEKVFATQSHASGLGAFIPLSLNIDPSVIAQEGFIEKIESLAERYGTNLRMITFEIIESGETDTKSMYLNIARLKLLGAKISLDDFGKGYSNLDRLEKIPFDEIKIDLNVISNVLVSEKERGMVVSMLSFMKTKNCKVVAEGVEDQETNDYLKKIGFEEAQGYYHSMPKPINEMERVFVRLFKERVSSLLGDMNPHGLKEIYAYFYRNAVDVLDTHIQCECDTQDLKVVSDFVHKMKGMLKTAGLHEAIILLEEYSESRDIEHIKKLKSFITYFNDHIISRTDLA